MRCVGARALPDNARYDLSILAPEGQPRRRQRLGGYADPYADRGMARVSRFLAGASLSAVSAFTPSSLLRPMLHTK